MNVIWPGTPGEQFENTGETIVYQFICSFVNTCGACAQYHLAVAKWWPKLHHGCNCQSRPIPPGEKSHPYEDWRDIVNGLPDDQKSALVGRSLYKLIESGEVEWADVVTSTRVRTLHEVVSREGLTVDQMTRSGVQKTVAERAHATVNTPEHQIVEQMRADLVKQIQELGIQPQHLSEMFGEQMARRVGIGGGPSKGWAMPTDSFRTEDDWVALLLASYRADMKNLDLIVKFTPRTPTQEELDQLRAKLADDPAGWIAEINAGLRAGTIYPPEVFDEYRRMGGQVPD